MRVALLLLGSALAGCSSLGGSELETAAVQPSSVASTAAQSDSQTDQALSGSRTFGASTQIPAIVNGEPVTKLMVDRRAAFMKLRRAPSTSRQAALDELIDDALKLQEGKRRGVNVPPDRINDAYANFAKSNKLTLSQLNTIMNQSGVTPAGFKDYIRAQITWSSLVAQRNNSVGGNVLSEREAVARMLEAGGEKPTATEYFLQQVIFVVPENQRSNTGISTRKREAETLRARFNNCDQTLDFAQGLRDVTVRDLGRKLGPELPSAWKSAIEKTSPGEATPVQTTPRGVEFIGVCRARQVSDDRTAQLVFAQQDAEATGDAGAAYLADLKKRAKIQTR